MSNFHLRPREDGKVDVIDGLLEGEGRVITTLDTEEEAVIYLTDLDAAGEGDNMPWELTTQGDKTCVKKKGAEGVLKCYDSHDAAVAYLRALYKNSMDAAIAAFIPEPVVVAHAELSGPPASFFTDPELPELQRWTSLEEDEGGWTRVYGHSAGEGECHIGILDRCVTIADIADGLVSGCNWEYAMPGHVVTADGTKVGTGPIPIKGGHADRELDWIGALAHYDDPATVVADVVYGRDEFGIWFSGAIRPTATPPMIYALRASGVSLDARGIKNELRYLTTCCVNTPGLPKADGAIAASGEIISVVAIGGRPLPDPGCDECRDDEDELIASLSNRVFTDEELDVLWSRINA